MPINFGKWLVFAGIALILLGFIIWGAGKIGLPFGKLPGDYSYQGEHTSVYFPIVSSLVISVILTIVINLVLWMMRR